MLGIDIVSIERMQRLVERFGIKGLRRFLSADEIKLCYKDSSKAFNISRIAGFWAAKEACAKALGVGICKELSFLDMTISKDSKNAPLMNLTQSKMREFGIDEIALSISHDGGFAIAAVLCKRCEKA
ncbi:4'-phosphopantetheinyl transferase [Helicobacter cinaedi PAGU611]|uniref:Holo-[acyl-carrier-protein] synthase n=2 Tax=Helicobacter cinaedi CCUG 18818 = ATCC BAA-847 TaxID=537971 RepID=A0AAI8MLG7_9HELI|nr:holo-ACP synthase [Helicobacter cinaedi]QOQ90079.1 holo-ACP synthase [Helicobacter cinaedi]BAM11795.1 4'-phosphopantetheinyl transferase [Helicobacter cinaedi PAGU611]BAM31778.1 4'-phosphopantetheinyl transferase [Helicobacter cinaedi CCUG 18818 = ATCC BAA-847]BBB19368.1 holo-[acyl-carrier protein] synthase [Helicobacter cinaedi]